MGEPVGRTDAPAEKLVDRAVAAVKRFKDRRPKPQWLTPGRDRVAERVERFRLDLQAIAVRTARHRERSAVDPKDVDEAFEHLAAVGLSNLPWWRRPQMKVTAAGAFLAASLAAPDMLPPWFEDGPAEDVAVLAGQVISGLLAVGVYVWACLQDHL